MPRIPVEWLDVPRGLKLGECLTLEVPAGALTRVAGLIFALPLAALLGGAWIGAWSGARLGLDADIVGGLVGLACLALVSGIVAAKGAAVAGMLKITARRQGCRERMNA